MYHWLNEGSNGCPVVLMDEKLNECKFLGLCVM